MKKLFLFVAVASFVFFAPSCSQDDSTESAVSEKEEILMSTAIEDPASLKAAYTGGPLSSNFTVDIPIGVYANNGTWLAGATNWINNDKATVVGTAPHNITFQNGPYYYPTDGSTVYVYAYAPAFTSGAFAARESTAPSAGSNPVVTIPINGQQDVMWGSSFGFKKGSSPASPPMINFQHSLTQLQFKFTASSTYPDGTYKVDSINIKAQPTAVLMNIGTGVCTFTGTKNMKVLQTSGFPIKREGNDAKSPIMTSPSSSYLVDIYVKAPNNETLAYTNIPIKLQSVVGSAHMIDINFTATGIAPGIQASVADWITGAGGTATAQ